MFTVFDVVPAEMEQCTRLSQPDESKHAVPSGMDVG